MKAAPSLRLRLGLQLGVLHLLLAGGAYLAWADQPWRLALAELGLLLSVGVAIYLVSRVDLHRRLVIEGRDLLRDEELNARLREVGFEEVDALVRLFNAAIARLREERVRQREQQAFLERIVEASPTAIVLLDLDGRVDAINPAGRQILGVEEGLIGATLAELPAPFGACLETLADGASTVVAAGARRFKASRARFWDRGFARSFVLVEELTEELRRGEREAWSRLVKIISHEVNNSVGAIASLLESCSSELAEGRLGPELETALGAGARRARALERFVAGYAEVVQLPPPERRRLELAALIDDLVLVLASELDARGISIGWRSCRRPAWIHADPNQIERVLMNVIRNAAEAIGEQGSIGIELSHDGDTVELAVVDDGPGIDCAARERLFSPFFSTKRDGRGLGLTLVREILVAHDFAFELGDAEGTPPRPGARFWLRAPALRDLGG